MENSTLLKLNSEGWIPGPDESESAFLERVQLASHLKEELGDSFEPCSEGKKWLQDASSVTNDFFGYKIDWLSIICSNHKLLPWDGGCAWIFQLKENGPRACFLQLRKHFLKSDRFLKIYSRQELIVHETAHAARMEFNEPRYEEILAYSTSSSQFRKYFGPMIQKPWEGVLGMLLLLLALSSPFFGNDQMVNGAWGLLFLAFFIASTRLFFRHIHYQRTLLKLVFHFKNLKKAKAFIFRLSDKEIKKFGKKSEEQIEQDIDNNKENSLRQRLLWLLWHTLPI